MKRRVCRERTRKQTIMLSLDMRSLFILATACLALLSVVRYGRLTNYAEGIAPSIHESLRVDSPAFPRGANTAHNLVDDRRGDARVSDGHGRFRGSSLDGVFHKGARARGSRALCRDRYVYIHSIPREYNEQLLEECHILKDWSDMCAALTNAGLGPAMRDAEEYFTPSGWYETNQFALEVIFHNRMKQYDCVTSDATKATAIYVPFYAGLEASRTLWKSNLTLRDEAPLKFNEWLHRQPEWKAHGGHDHFMIGGRITWDFRRKGPTWGNVLLNLPVMQNMTTLVIEASTWDTNDVGIPYPSYFHPSSDGEIHQWQSKVRSFARPVLFSFAGGARNAMPRLIRGQIIDQCRRSPLCKLLNCDGGACQSPQQVMKLFEQSIFCLQPQGDSATRRSIFDSMLAGCIPVFFHVDSYFGYNWHFPQNQSDYSVFISEDHIRSGILSIESVLRHISANQIRKMRETIIRLIPNFVYADPRGSILKESTDAFGIAMKVPPNISCSRDLDFSE
jgi:hypothetical protein